MEQEKTSAVAVQLSQYFKPAIDWQTCTMPLEGSELWRKVEDLLPNMFTDYQHLKETMLFAGFKYEYNEHNDKFYWLINNC